MNQEIQIYLNARKTILKMCEDRGYNVNPQLNSIGPIEFKIMFDHNDLDISNGISDTLEGRELKTYVKFLTPSIADMKTEDIIKQCNDYYFDEPFEQGKFRLIIVVAKFEKRHDKDLELYLNNKYIELHEVIKISINPTLHQYQPKFRLLSNEEALQIYKKYNASPQMMPAICIDDPINKYYHGLFHQMYEIKEEGIRIFYRIITSRRVNGEAK